MRRFASLLALGLLPACGGETPCPDIAIIPQVFIAADPPLGQGDYTVTLTADGATETCRVTVGPPIPAAPQGDMVRSPMTNATTDCKGLQIGGLLPDGRVSGFPLPGTPKDVSVSLARADGTPLGAATARPDYTPGMCGVIRPEIRLALPG